MQKDESSSKPIFILPKPVYKHEHNIRFLTPHSSRKRQIFGYSEKASANSLGLKVENLKRDLLRFQMKSRLEDEPKKSTDRTDQSQSEQHQRSNNPPLYSDAVDNLKNKSKQPPGYPFAQPLSQQRVDTKKENPSPTSYTGKPDAAAKEFRYERTSSKGAFNPNGESSHLQEGTMLSKFIPSSKLLNVKSSGKISFFKDSRPERPPVYWKMYNKGRDEIVDARKSTKNVTASAGTDRTHFDEPINSPGKKSETGIYIPRSAKAGIVRSSLFSMPATSQLRMRWETEQKIEGHHELYAKVQQQNRERTGIPVSMRTSEIDTRKRHLPQEPEHSQSLEAQGPSGTTLAQPGRSPYRVHGSPGSQHGGSESEPRRKLSRHDSTDPKSEERMRHARYIEAGNYRLQAKSSDNLELDGTIPSPQSGGRAPIPSAARPTAIVQADQKGAGEAPKNCSSFYNGMFMANVSPRAISCGCQECQIAYRASRGDSRLSGGAETHSISYSSHRVAGDPFEHKNVDVLIKNRYDSRQPAFSTQRIENVEQVSPSFTQGQVNRTTSRRSGPETVNGSRKEIYYFPKNEKYFSIRTSDSSRPNDQAVLVMGERQMPFSGRSYVQGGYWGTVSPNRNYPESYSHFANPEERYTRKSTIASQRSSLNSSPERGSTTSEKIRNPPRLIGSSFKAMETYRDRSCEKGYSDMSQRYETNSPHSRKTEECSGGDIFRPGVRKKSQVIVMYQYPRKQRLIQKGEGGPFIESVSYSIHEKVFCENYQISNPSKTVTHWPNAKGDYVEAPDGLHLQSTAETENKPITSRTTPVESTSTSKQPHLAAKDKAVVPVEGLVVTSPSTASIDTEREVDETDSAFSVTDSDDDVTSLDGATQKIPSKPGVWKRTAKSGGPRLYRFLLELLEQPEKYPCIKWLNKEERMFKFYDSEYVARLWGRRKNRPNMKYENFARSLRCYKERGILRKPRQKLVYQFANGW